MATYRKNRRTGGTFRVRTGWTQAAKDFVDEKTTFLIEQEGESPQQAYAHAISVARSRGYKIPERKK